MTVFQITHLPQGIEHPYQTEPTERQPRQPIDGQPVVIGAEITADAQPEQVYAEWQVGDQPIRRVESDSPRGNLYQMTLPASHTAASVRYRIGAQTGTDLTLTDWYTYTTHGWHSIGAPVAVQSTSANFSILFSSSSFVPAATLSFSVHAGSLRACLDSNTDIQPSTQGWQHISSAEHTLEGFSISVAAAPYEINITRPDGSLLLRSSDLPVFLSDGKTVHEVNLSFHSPADESFCGFGERYNAINQRGNRLDIMVYEQYKNQGERTYLPIPFFVSNQKYAFRISDAVLAHFDLCKQCPDRWQVQAELNRDHKFCFEIWASAAPLKNISDYLKSTHLPKQPPAWVFGPWMSSNEWNSQAEVMKQADLTRDLDIPCSVLVIEAWADEATFYIWNDAQYIPKPGSETFSYSDFTFPADGLWPDPKGMIEELHRRGIKLVLWQIPVLRKMEEPHQQNANDREYMLSQGYHLKYADGSPYLVRPIWFNGSHLLDPSNLAGVDWWLKKRAYLLDELKVDGFKTDGGEHLWAEDVVFHNGMRGHEGMNAYPDLYIGAYHRFANEHRDNQAVTFSRAGFSQAPAFPCHWAGDENSTWPAYRASIRAGINAGLCGVIYWGWDIAGFSKELPSAELFLRAAAMAVFCPIMQYHSEYHNHDIPSHDRTPWNMAEQTGRPEVLDLYRKFAHLRTKLLPYIQSEVDWCSANGEPLMRAMFLDAPDDPVAWSLDDQYLFGRGLLIAPIVEEGVNSRRVYLPAGSWTDFWTGDKYTGPAWVEAAAELDTIPVFKKDGAGSILDPLP